ncbi:ubiquitin carboxyl-terminal hydrolase 27 isoform X2 [Typha angustifolia]|uniref:ubiquitin carboxyl-terminal hydrolase 27 isoform X2 n=1 Tax=Typha angustifolia TaxID=59011 RepID=UPI003C30612B
MKRRKVANIHNLIHNLKHRLEILSWIQDLPASQYHVVAGILGLGMGIAGLYVALQDGNSNYIGIPWISERKDPSEIIYYVGGLQNLGNNCFLNVILQGLASCSSFLPFYQNILVADLPFTVDKIERMPLTVALTSLLEELCITREERIVLNPRNVMFALSMYVSRFKLTRQQDAAESFLHLLSSLKNEISQSCVPHGSSLAHTSASPSRIYSPKGNKPPQYEQWKHHLLGPCDGTIGSILACRSCSSVLSMDFEHFLCLPLSPVLGGNADIMDGCTLVDCLRYFTAVEHLEYYRCDRCWHIAALKYLSLKSKEDKEKIDKISHCVNLDSCDCRHLFLPEEIPSNSFSHALKQLSITRCPKILCIHLQRALINVHGDFIKHQGHISFPLLLDLFPFTIATTNMGQGTLVESMQQRPSVVTQRGQINMQPDMQILPHLFKMMEGDLSAETLTGNNWGKPIDELPGSPVSGTIFGISNNNITHRSGMFDSNFGCAMDEQIGTSSSCHSKSTMYSLCSVVEHYGRYGSGHYAAYRRVKINSNGIDSMEPLLTADNQWLYVSDREVSHVSEETVLAAEASLLFYERI